MRRSSMILGGGLGALAAAAAMVSATEMQVVGPPRRRTEMAKPAADPEHESRQRKRWLQRQARKAQRRHMK